MVYVLKRLGDVRPGDVLVDGHGSPTLVVSRTPVRRSVDMYALTFVNGAGRRRTVHADGDHVWPLDRVRTRLAGPMEDRWGWTLTSRGMYDRRGDGSDVWLEQVPGGEAWRLVSACRCAPADVVCVGVDSPAHTFLIADTDMVSDSEEVPDEGVGDGPVALTDMPTGFVTGPVDGDTDAGAATVTAPDGGSGSSGSWLRRLLAFLDPSGTHERHEPDAPPSHPALARRTMDRDYVLEHSLATHNCGGPLTLDTRLMTPGGGTIPMGDAEPGMELVGSNGRTVTVLSVSPVMRAEDLYEVEFERVPD